LLCKRLKDKEDLSGRPDPNLGTFPIKKVFIRYEQILGSLEVFVAKCKDNIIKIYKMNLDSYKRVSTSSTTGGITPVFSSAEYKNDKGRKSNGRSPLVIGIITIGSLVIGAMLFFFYSLHSGESVNTDLPALKSSSLSAEEHIVSIHPETDFHIPPPPNPQEEDLLPEKLKVPPEEINDPEKVALDIIDKIRKMKFNQKIVIEKNIEAQTLIKKAQQLLRNLLIQRYGEGAIYVEMIVKLPKYLITETIEEQEQIDANGPELLRTLRIEMAPIAYVPYSVYFFIENIVKPFRSGSFHRNAGHVLQAMLQRQEWGGKHTQFAWQEYNPLYPHKKWTLGYAGRPSSSGAMYISTLDNTYNHGPASQGSKTEADCIIGRLADEDSIETVKLMTKQKGAGKGGGFIQDKKNWINIVSMRVTENNMNFQLQPEELTGKEGEEEELLNNRIIEQDPNAESKGASNEKYNLEIPFTNAEHPPEPETVPEAEAEGDHQPTV
jgi:hypothetical protein